MLKSLANLFYKKYPEMFAELVFNDRPALEQFSLMDFQFICNGKKYYRYKDDLNIPLERKSQLDILLIELSTQVEGRDLDIWIDAMQKALAGSLEGRPSDLAKIGFLLTQLKSRKDGLFHQDITFALIAGQYIREDEKSWVWNQALQNEKIKDLRDEFENEGKLYDFFVQAKVSDLIPFTNISTQELWQYWTISGKLHRSKSKAILDAIGS